MSNSPVHTLHPPPTASSSTSPCPEPASLRTASRSRATLGLSNLTTRSSSASRIYCPDQHYASLVSPVWPGAASTTTSSRDDDVPPAGPESHAYRAWRREARAGALRAKGKRRSLGSAGELAQHGNEDRGVERGGGGRRASKGKDKAVAFVVGISSSGDEGDAEYEDEGEPDAGRGAGDLLRRREGLFGHLLEGDALVPREPSIGELIRAQVRQPVRTVDPQDLDSLLQHGIGDYTYAKPFSPSRSSSIGGPSSEAPQDSPKPEGDERSERISLGKGKFSEVLLVRKGNTEYALKHTALHPHHQLISTRLLREPTILAQLLPHRNLVKVFETIRTPGHLYLVEECLRSSVTLEDLVASSPDGVLPPDQAWSILDQLASVVKSLHEPLRVCHRDIKPENILVRVDSSTSPATLHLKLLDFGLATHFSQSEPKLTTCCGSPAYHSPELWRGLRDKFGSVRYWGPEVDAWCVGLTVLRCVTPSKYPLGIGHTSLQSLADKVVDALLTVPDAAIRQVLAGLLHLDGVKRMRAFDRFCRSLPERQAKRADREGRSALSVDDSRTSSSPSPSPSSQSQQQQAPAPPREKKEFKTTAFVPAPLAHRLELFLDEQSFARSEGPKLEATIVGDSLDGLVEQVASSCTTIAPSRTSRSTSSTRTATAEQPQVCAPPVVASGLARAASSSPETPTSLGRTSLSSSPTSPHSPTLTASNTSTDSLTSAPSTAPPTPSSYSLPFPHPSYPPPVELTLLNPTNEPIRRAVSYIKYALRCKGILYHVRDDSNVVSSQTASPFIGGTPASFGLASPDSAPPSLPPTPHAQPPAPFGGFPFPSSPASTANPDESFVAYLQCVVLLPPSSSSDDSNLSPATFRLRATLQQQHERTQQRRRPGMPARANTHTGFEPRRSASTPPQRLSDLTGGATGGSPGGRKGAQPDKVEALSFFLSIRKPAAVEGDLTSAARRRRRRSRRSAAAKGGAPADEDEQRDIAYASRVVVTLSDDRALSFVRDALALTDGADSVPTDVALVSDETDADAERRGRGRRAGQVTSPRPGQGDNSGSRDARTRRREAAAELKRGEERATASGGVSAGLGMAMGPPAQGGGGGGGGGASGLWDFTSLVGRLVGGTGRGSRSSSREEQASDDQQQQQQRRTRARSSLRL
ncbi:hypothetical protein JCM3775_006532 [Rhodotorula graminis]